MRASPVYEPFGLVNVEAMACGTAVVASDVRASPRSSSTAPSVAERTVALYRSLIGAS